MMLTFSLGVYAMVFQNIFLSSVCAKVCTGGAYSGEYIYTCSKNQAVFLILQTSRVTLKLV
jgi:hypothetical protein